MSVSLIPVTNYICTWIDLNPMRKLSTVLDRLLHSTHCPKPHEEIYVLSTSLHTDTATNDRSTLTHKGNISLTNKFCTITMHSVVTPAMDNELFSVRSITGTGKLATFDNEFLGTVKVMTGI